MYGKPDNKPQVVTRIMGNTSSSAIANNLTDKRLSSREIWALGTHVKPHKLDPKTLADIYAALRKRDNKPQ